MTPLAHAALCSIAAWSFVGAVGCVATARWLEAARFGAVAIAIGVHLHAELYERGDRP